MSQPPTPTLREQAEALVDAVNARDFDAFTRIPMFDPEFEFYSALSAAEGQSHVGISGMREWAESIDSVWADHRIQIVDFRELDDGRVVVIFRVTGEARGSGIPLDMRTGQVWTFRNGKLWRNQSYTDPQEALEAAGLSE